VISPLPVANPLNQQSVTLRVMINPLLSANPLKHKPIARKNENEDSTFNLFLDDRGNRPFDWLVC
jgi:hypothetical protein